jgi:hypothetical protein
MLFIFKLRSYSREAINIAINFLFIATNDDYVEITYHTNSCYLIPILIGGWEKYYHKTKGSFINQLSKILDFFAIKIGENEIESEEEVLSKIEVCFNMILFYPYCAVI